MAFITKFYFVFALVAWSLDISVMQYLLVREHERENTFWMKQFVVNVSLPFVIIISY